MKREQNIEREGGKTFTEKNLEAISILGDTVDIINGQGCLIRQDGIVLFGPDDHGEIKQIKEFTDITKATSHAYMSCAEVHGKYKNGVRFYIHANGAHNLRTILTEIHSQIGNQENPIEDLTIRCDFGRNKDKDKKEELVKQEISEYERVSEEFGISSNDITVDNIEYGGVYPEKVVGFEGEEDRHYDR